MPLKYILRYLKFEFTYIISVKLFTEMITLYNCYLPLCKVPFSTPPLKLRKELIVIFWDSYVSIHINMKSSKKGQIFKSSEGNNI